MRRRSYFEHLSVRNDDARIDEKVPLRVFRHVKPWQRARRRAVNHVALEIEAAAMAWTGDHLLVRFESGDAAEMRADRRERVDAVRRADDVRLLLLVEA